MLGFKEILKTGFGLRKTSEKGEGIFAAKSFKVGDIVMVGIIKEVLNGNHAHASQIAENQHVLHDGLITKVNHSCDPNCGIRVNETGAHDFVAIKDISVNEEITFDYLLTAYIPEARLVRSSYNDASLLNYNNKE